VGGPREGRCFPADSRSGKGCGGGGVGRGTVGKGTRRASKGEGEGEPRKGGAGFCLGAARRCLGGGAGCLAETAALSGIHCTVRPLQRPWDWLGSQCSAWKYGLRHEPPARVGGACGRVAWCCVRVRQVAPPPAGRGREVYLPAWKLCRKASPGATPRATPHTT